MSPPASPSPDAAGIAVQVAARLLAEGRADEASARLAALVAAAPAYPAALVLLARALEASGRDAEALDAWHRAHFLVPNSPLVRRERQRLLEAAAAAPPTEPEAATSSEALAAAPAGDLPDAHFALTEEEGMAPEEEVEAPPLAQETPTAEDDEAAAAEEGTVEEAEAVEAAPPPAPPAEAREEAPAAEIVCEEAVDGEPEAEAEPPIAPPDVAEPPSEPVAGEPESDAAWWRRTLEPAPHAPEDDDEGWSVLGETEAAPSDPGVSEPHVAPPGPPPPPPAVPDEEAVEDARVIPAAADAPPTLADELDALIHRLEDAPRIRPDPTFHGPDVSFDEEGDDDLVSETLARIYAAQRQYAEAAIVYEKLAQQRPGEADEMLRRAAEMRAQGGG